MKLISTSLHFLQGWRIWLKKSKSIREVNVIWGSKRFSAKNVFFCFSRRNIGRLIASEMLTSFSFCRCDVSAENDVKLGMLAQDIGSTVEISSSQNSVSFSKHSSNDLSLSADGHRGRSLRFPQNEDSKKFLKKSDSDVCFWFLLCWLWASKVSERPAFKSSFDFESFDLKKEKLEVKVQFYIFLNYN